MPSALLFHRIGTTESLVRQNCGVQSICDDLAAEHHDLDGVVGRLNDSEWLTPTASPGWAIRDQISHLWFFDQRALMALTDPDAFAADALWMMANGGPDRSVEPGRSIEPAELLTRWREGRQQLLDAASVLDPSTRVPWYGPAMAARSFITARLMETWAHGQDIVDALGVSRMPTARLRHVAHIGVRARPFSYAVNNMTMPPVDVVVRLTGPDGEEWSWGDDDGKGSVNSGVGPGARLLSGGDAAPPPVRHESRHSSATRPRSG